MRLRENSLPVLRAAAGAGAPAGMLDEDGAEVDEGGISWVGSTAAAAERLEDDADVMECPSPPLSRLPISTLHCNQTQITN